MIFIIIIMNVIISVVLFFLKKLLRNTKLYVNDLCMNLLTSLRRIVLYRSMI